MPASFLESVCDSMSLGMCADGFFFIFQSITKQHHALLQLSPDLPCCSTPFFFFLSNNPKLMGYESENTTINDSI